MIRRILQAVLNQIDRRICQFANITDQPVMSWHQKEGDEDD